MTTAICFDLDGTLVGLDRPYREVARAALSAHLEEVTDALVETYDEAFFEAFSAMEPDPFEAGMAAVLAEADAAEEADPAAMVDTLREEEFAALTVDDALPPALDRLGEDAALGVVTDGTPDWQRAKLERAGLKGRFDAVVTSYEAGAHKPDPAPFELARERLPDADEHAMVGDDDADVEGARAAGFVPVRFDPDAEPNFWETVDALL